MFKSSNPRRINQSATPGEIHSDDTQARDVTTLVGIRQQVEEFKLMLNIRLDK